MSDRILLLVDGSSYLYRAYHALPDLRSPSGFPTGAIRGVVSMMKLLREQYPAAHGACVFDAKGRTFRDDWYADYKANRAPMPDDLGLQIEPIVEAVKLLGWPVLSVPGIEADDAIGTISCMATKGGFDVVISTGDKDLAQLVGERVTLINTMSSERLDMAGVTAKFGVPPERIVDYLALIGDSVDNVPGVAKVGPKTAAKWLAEHGSLDAVMAAAPGDQGCRRREPAAIARLAAARQAPRPPCRPIATSPAMCSAGPSSSRSRSRRSTSRPCSTSTSATASGR